MIECSKSLEAKIGGLARRLGILTHVLIEGARAAKAVHQKVVCLVPLVSLVNERRENKSQTEIAQKNCQVV